MTVGTTGEMAATRRTAGACTPGVNASPDEKAAATTSRRMSDINFWGSRNPNYEGRFHKVELKAVTGPLVPQPTHRRTHMRPGMSRGMDASLHASIAWQLEK